MALLVKKKQEKKEWKSAIGRLKKEWKPRTTMHLKYVSVKSSFVHWRIFHFVLNSDVSRNTVEAVQNLTILFCKMTSMRWSKRFYYGKKIWWLDVPIGTKNNSNLHFHISIDLTLLYLFFFSSPGISKWVDTEAMWILSCISTLKIPLLIVNNKLKNIKTRTKFYQKWITIVSYIKSLTNRVIFRDMDIEQFVKHIKLVNSTWDVVLYRVLM